MSRPLNLTSALALTALISTSAEAAILRYEFTDNSKTPTTDTSAAANGGAVTASGFTLTDTASGNPGPAVRANSGSDVQNAPFDFSDYFQFVISKDPLAASYTIESIRFDYDQFGATNNSGQLGTFYLFSSVGGFSSGNQVAGPFTNGTEGWETTGIIALGGTYANLTTPTTFRIYVHDGTTISAPVTPAIDNIEVAIAVPEPSTAALLGLAGLALRRRVHRLAR